MSLSAQAAHEALAAIVDPVTKLSLDKLKMIDDLDVTADVAKVTLRLPFPSYPFAGALVEAIVETLKGAGATSVEVDQITRVSSREIQQGDPCPGVKNIILVMSGKGGVGKSTVATNLTMALADMGANVGLLDADMYGPSVPTMFGVGGKPVSADGQKFLPLERFGVKLMSIGFLLEDDRQAVIWRGPMLQSALLQFLKDVDWGPLDVLVLDLPPGTGDITLTISQKMKTTGAVVVTTPQAVALQDVYKSVSMAQKVGIPLLGVVENESYFICDGCDKRHELFGTGGGQSIAHFAEAPLLGQLPIDPSVRQWGDAGTPVVKAAPESSIAGAFREVAGRLVAHMHAENAQRSGGPVIDRSGGKNRHLPIAR